MKPFIFATVNETKIRRMDNETFKILTDTFNNVCFPIACCIALFWTLAKQNKELKQAIDKNTNVLTELKTIISLRNEK